MKAATTAVAARRHQGRRVRRLKRYQTCMK